MNIMIAASDSAYYSRDEIAFAKCLKAELSRRGHKADMFRLPVSDEVLSLPEQMVLMGMLDIGTNTDLLITIGYPAFNVPHHNKIVCLFRLVPELHEGWDSEYGVIGSPQYASLKSALLEAEKRCFKDARIFCWSNALAKDIHVRYGMNANILKMPDIGLCTDEIDIKTDDTYFIIESTLHPADRIELVLDAVAVSKKEYRLLICVPDCNEVYKKALIERINRLDIEDSVDVIYSGATESLLSNAIACISIPFEARTSPYFFIKAIAKSVPVITTIDSGCLSEYVMHDKNGAIVASNAADIGVAIDQFAKNSRNKERMLMRKIETHSYFQSIQSVAEKLTEDV